MAKAPRKRKSAVSYSASIYQDEPLPEEFCQFMSGIEEKVQAQIWLLMQNAPRDDRFAMISPELYKGFQVKADEIATNGRVALIIESPGGIPDAAYRICRLFQRRAARFVVIVPQYAKSATMQLLMRRLPKKSDVLSKLPKSMRRD